MTLLEFGGACVFEQRPGCAAAFLDHPVTDAKVTVAGLRELVESIPPSMPRRDAMRLEVIGGAAPWALVEQVRARLTERVYNNLGSTEAGGIATTLLEKPGDQQCYSVLPWREVAVVDDDDQPVAQGQIGRLRIKLMDGDAHGYFGEPELSRAFFRNGYFYPGDLALFSADGRLALQGRASDVIALRGGDKIATAPFEQDIATALGASGVCLLATPHPTRGDDDFHLVIESEGEFAQEALASAIALLPLPGLTVHVHLMKSAPRNAMGKLDRIALRAHVARAALGA